MTPGLIRTVLVTGAARRIGRALALDLATNGWSVAVHYHTHREEAESLVAEIAARDVPAVAVPADLAREDETAAVMERATAALGPVTCLINNASAFELDGADNATRRTWDLHFEVNLRAPFVLTQQLARQLPEGQAGNVINLLDQRVLNPTPYFVTYTASKSALWTLTQTLALALAPRIRVNAIGPGPTLRSTRQSEEDFRRQWESTPLQRGTTPAEIAEAVRFILASPAMTGQLVALDGGQHLGWAVPPARRAPLE